MVMLTGSALFTAFFALLQLVLAGALFMARRAGAIERLLAILFLANGLTTAAIAASALRPAPSFAVPASFYFDAPTGALILALALLVFQHGADVVRGHKWLWPAVVGILVLYGIPPFLGVFGAREATLWTSPALFFGYSLLLVAIVRRGVDPETMEGHAALWLFVGFAPRTTEFTVVYTLRRPLLTGDWIYAVDSTFHILLTVTLLALLAHFARLLVVQRGRRRKATGLMALALIGGFCLGVAQTGDWAGVGAYVVSVLTLIVLRPLAVGYGYLGTASWRLFGATALAFGTYLGLKGLISFLTADPLLEMGRADVAAIGLTVVVAPALLLGLRSRDLAPRDDPQSQGTSGGAPTNAERLLAWMAQEARGGHEGPGVTSAEIAEAIGIGANNVAAEVRRARRMLEAVHADTDADPLIWVTVAGVRAKKRYGLTPAGAAAAATLEERSRRAGAGPISAGVTPA